MILMYHHVCPAASVPVEGDRVPLEGWGYNIEPADFEFQLTSLASRGWKFTTMDNYLEGMGRGARHPRKQLVVTFDDGWRDNHTWAFPVLKKLGIPAVFFIVSGPMAGIDPVRRMTPGMLRELQDGGMVIGAHTRTHPNLEKLSKEDLAEELGGCRRELEEITGRPVDLLAYPGGRFSRQVVEVTKEQGFRAACSTLPGGRNEPCGRYWLYREVFSPRLNTFRDRLLLHPLGRWMQGVRSRPVARRKMAGRMLNPTEKTI